MKPDDSESHVPVLWRKRILVDGTAGLPILVRGVPESLPFIELDAARDGAEQVNETLALPGASRFIDPMFELGRYEPASRARVVQALAIARWSAETQFCAACGFALRWESPGRIKVCENPREAHRHFPRIDPATIVLVEDGDRVLLGRQPGWPPGLYSTLAGFVEAGETAEEAAAREVFEESGIRIAELRYAGSEPWPFPRSLMLGYVARATTTAIVRGDELEDVRWFEVAEVRRLQQMLLREMPGGDSIARRLIAQWLAAKG